MESSEQKKNEWYGFGCSMKNHMHCHGCGSALYGLGFLGALVYYLTTATSLLAGFFGVLKAIVWPAFLVYGVLKFLGA
jgi:hypothetical protein